MCRFRIQAQFHGLIGFDGPECTFGITTKISSEKTSRGKIGSRDFNLSKCPVPIIFQLDPDGVAAFLGWISGRLMPTDQK
jgi:hypothetical protein